MSDEPQSPSADLFGPLTGPPTLPSRSAEALAVVKGAGFSDAIHVGGGITAWVHQIEPDKPSY